MTEFEQNVVAEETVTEVTKTGKGKKGLLIGLGVAVAAGVAVAIKNRKKIGAAVKNLFGKKKQATVNCDVEEQMSTLFEEN